MDDQKIPCAGCTRFEACDLIERCLDKSPLHDDYKPVDLSQFVFAPPNGGPTLEPCPVCGSAASLWQYSESETAPRKLLVCCTHSEPIGPQDGLAHEGCPLYMPPDNFYRETIRDAVRYWNEFAKALGQLQSGNAERNAGVRVEAPPSEAQVRAAFEKRMLDFGWRNFEGSAQGEPKCWYYDNSDLNARWVGWREAVRAAGVTGTPAARRGVFGWRKCEFCGCNTNARFRVCCEKGKAADGVEGRKP